MASFLHKHTFASFRSLVNNMSFKSITAPLTIGDITIKNRVGMSAMTRNRAPHTYPSDLMKEYYVQRALGGAGLIATEGILITRQG